MGNEELRLLRREPLLDVRGSLVLEGGAGDRPFFMRSDDAAPQVEVACLVHRDCHQLACRQAREAVVDIEVAVDLGLTCPPVMPSS